jgi:hypothetical protein
MIECLKAGFPCSGPGLDRVKKTTSVYVYNSEIFTTPDRYLQNARLKPMLGAS